MSSDTTRFYGSYDCPKQDALVCKVCEVGKFIINLFFNNIEE